MNPSGKKSGKIKNPLDDFYKSEGVNVLDEITSFDYGKFVHILDEEGNKLELWEPIDRVFTAMGGATTK